MKMKSLVRSSLALLVLLAGSIAHAHAAVIAIPVPEIDPGTATSGLVLLGGLALMVRGRRR